MNTHNIVCTFGKFEGQLLTRIPVGYLQWAINTNVDTILDTVEGKFPFHELAKAEIERRGERIKDMDISAHAIDRFSLKYLKVWRDNRKPDEGLMSFMQRMGLEAWQNRWTLPHDKQEDNHWKVFHIGIEWCFEELIVPIVKTVI